MNRNRTVAAAAAFLLLAIVALSTHAAEMPAPDATAPAHAAPAGGESMNIYLKIAAQALNFLLFAWLLSRFLIKPVRQMMKKRHNEMEADRQKAEEMRTEADRIREKAEAAARDLENKRDGVLKEAREQAEAERKKQLEQADQQGQERIERFRRIIEQERDELMTKVSDDLRQTILAVSGAALKDAAGALTDRAIDRLGAQLDDLSDADRDTARQAVAADQPAVKVLSATPLDEEQADRLRSLLGDTFGAENVELDVEEDESLLAGIEVHLGHLRVQAHWRREVDEALKSLEEGQG
jgi:F-type H+-transporting ATPase subunit b